MNKLLPPVIKQKSGYEFFLNGERDINLCTIDFWRWALSNLTSNQTQKMFAEFIVATALNRHNEVRNENDVFNLETKNGKKVEVLSSSYIQTWSRNGLPNISFTLNPSFGWDAEIPLQSCEGLHLIDMFVFCLLHHRNEHTLNPMNLSQWTFFIIHAQQLEKSLTEKRIITLTELKKLNPIMCGFDNLRRVIESVASE